VADQEASDGEKFKTNRGAFNVKQRMDYEARAFAKEAPEQRTESGKGAGAR
jgi:hypothetical protein